MLRKTIRGAAAGAAAGAAGTTALYAITYADMAVRGRPSSDTPAQTVERVAARTGVGIPGDEETRGSRLSGLGALSGVGVGVGVGAAYGAARALGWRPPTPVGALLAAAAAMIGSDAPMAALGVADPRAWGPADWASDAVPHLGYGIVTAITLAALIPAAQRAGG